MYHVYWNQAAAYLSLYFFFFLSNFQTLKIFITLFSRTVRPRRLKLGRYTRGQWADISCIPESGCCCLLVPLFHFLSLQFSNIKFFFTLFSRTMRPKNLKLGTHIDSGQMYQVYWSQAADAYLSHYFCIFLSLQFSNVNIFSHSFLRNCEA